MCVTQESSKIFCSFGLPKKKKNMPVVSPRKRRLSRKGNKQIECPWEIKFTTVGDRFDSEGNRINRLSAHVRITSCKLMHSDECLPGTGYQSLAKKSSGAYQIHPVAMEEVLKIMTCGPIQNSTLSHWIREVGGVPLSVGIYCSQYRVRSS